MRPAYQKQHKIPEVYLKKFGYLNDEGKCCISILDKHRRCIFNETTKKFSKEINLFDFPFDNLDENRLIEDNFGLIENEYNTLVKIIENQKRIIDPYKEILIQFVSRLICGADNNRAYYKGLYENEKLREGFLEEISMFEDESVQRELVKIYSALGALKIDYMNAIIYSMMGFLNKVLACFNMLFLKFPEQYWLTSDNPVIVDRQENYDWIIPIESEMYIPLSKTICMFMFHKNSQKQNNPLRKLEKDKVHLINEEIFLGIVEKIYLSDAEYLIFPCKYENQSLIK